MTEASASCEQRRLKASHFLPLKSSGNRSERAGVAAGAGAGGGGS